MSGPASLADKMSGSSSELAAFSSFMTSCTDLKTSTMLSCHAKHRMLGAHHACMYILDCSTLCYCLQKPADAT